MAFLQAASLVDLVAYLVAYLVVLLEVRLVAQPVWVLLLLEFAQRGAMELLFVFLRVEV